MKNRKCGKNTHLLPGSNKNKEGRDSRPAAAGAWKRQSERDHVSAGGECWTQLKATAQGKLSTRVVIMVMVITTMMMVLLMTIVMMIMVIKLIMMIIAAIVKMIEVVIVVVVTMMVVVLLLMTMMMMITII